jgi:hypothetical protein
VHTERQISELETQLARTLRAFEEGHDATGDPELETIIEVYKKALQDSQNITACDIKGGCLDHLLNRARGYLETSSEWDQPFLREMGQTEKLIKDLSGS